FGGLFNLGGGRRGPGASPPTPPRGADIEVAVRVSFEDALRGVTLKVPVVKAVGCTACHGTGAAPGTSPKICPDCKGRGVTSESQGFFSISNTCRTCGGAGTVIETPCGVCGGSGRVRSTKTYRVRVPAGVRNGTRIKVKGKGEAAPRGGEPGDLFVVTQVTESPTFKWRGEDLVVEVPVTFSEAAMGASIEIPTPDGERVTVKVPAGTTDGKLLRVKGRGAPKLKGSGTGDVLVRVRIAVPSKVTKQERETLEKLDELQRASHGDPREKLVTDDHPRYTISVAAELAGMHPQTLRVYEARGLVRPRRTPGGTRRYSDRDVDRLRKIGTLTGELGLNLAGAIRVLDLEDAMEALAREVASLHAKLDAAAE